MASERKVAVKKELYKTELCRHYAIGKRCPYRSKCQFAHGSDEIVDIARHPKYKTEPCKSYHSHGFCTYGPRCHFIHDYTDDFRFTRSCNGELRTGNDIQDDETQKDDHESEQRASNRRPSDLTATKVTSGVSSLPDEGVFRGVSQEWSHGSQGSLKAWRQEKQDSTEREDSHERSLEVQRQNADNYLIHKSFEQTDRDFSVEGCWVKDENAELTEKSHFFTSLFSVKESVDNKFDSSSFYRNSFFHLDFPRTRQIETQTGTRPDDSANFRTISKYPNAMISSNENLRESGDLLNLIQASHQHGSPNIGRILWTQHHYKKTDNASIDQHDGGDQNAKYFCSSSLRAMTVDVFRRSPCSSHSSSASNELVCEGRKIDHHEVLSIDLHRILEDLSKEQMFALQSSLLMDTLSQNLQQSTYG